MYIIICFKITKGKSHLGKKKFIFRSKRDILKLSFRSDHKYTTNTGDKQIQTYHWVWPDLHSEGPKFRQKSSQEKSSIEPSASTWLFFTSTTPCGKILDHFFHLMTIFLLVDSLDATQPVYWKGQWILSWEDKMNPASQSLIYVI